MFLFLKFKGKGRKRDNRRLKRKVTIRFFFHFLKNVVLVSH